MRKHLRLKTLFRTKFYLIEKKDEHPLKLLIGAGGSDYDDFDLQKERLEMWPR
jgi:hypothetical protein